MKIDTFKSELYGLSLFRFATNPVDAICMTVSVRLLGNETESSILLGVVIQTKQNWYCRIFVLVGDPNDYEEGSTEALFNVCPRLYEE
jgi:hypothetical protein